MTASRTATAYKRGLLRHVVSQLADQRWSIYQSNLLYRIVDETILGLDFARSESKELFTVRVFVRPLYWPRPYFAYGLMENLGVWMGRAQLWWPSDWIYEGSPVNTDVLETLNRKVIPLFSGFHNSEAILQYHNSHPFDPFLSFRRTLCGQLDTAPECFGYIAAWSGRQLEAHILLRQALFNLRGQTSEGVRAVRIHIKETMALLGQREQLRLKLTETAASVRGALRLEQRA